MANIPQPKGVETIPYCRTLRGLAGCLGAFTVVAMFSHKLISFGALVTTMIATSGDESFVMFALFPKQALLLTGLLLVLGIFAGYLTDLFYPANKIKEDLEGQCLTLHNEEQCTCFQKHILKTNLLHPSLQRLTVSLGIIAILIGLLAGVIAGKAEMWVKGTLLLSFSFALFIVITVPDHFLKEHVWNHIVKVHLPRIFLWVFGISLGLHVLNNYVDVEHWISDNLFTVLLIAVLLGIIPESGPHLVFVTLFAAGTIPFSILLASSISQDGHGMLPMLAESRKGFIAVKLINMGYAFIIGGASLLFGV